MWYLKYNIAAAAAAADAAAVVFAYISWSRTILFD